MLLNSNDCISARNIWYSYGRDTILQDVSLEINQGEFVGIAGPNGAGKTTLMKVLVGLLPLQKGTIEFTCSLHKHRGSRPCRHSCIGYVPQQPLLREQQFPVTVREIIEMGRIGNTGTFKGLTSEDYKEVEKTLSEAGLTEIQNELFGDLSGGQQQRVLVARAFVSKPHILALDEPTSGVDAKGKRDFYELLNHMREIHNMSIILILHDLPDIVQKVQRLLFLNKKIIYDGPSEKIGADGLWNLMVSAGKIE